MDKDRVDALVVGGGPAGLMAAETLSDAGLSVLVADRMPSLGRKFLMAGKSGLNLTKAEGIEAFRAAYSDAAPALLDALQQFGPEEMVRWAEGLGQPMFTGSTGRVFPEVMKASPLLRAWLARLSERGVEFRTRWCWTGWEASHFIFETPKGRITVSPDVAVFAVGGGSWARLGSDGAWRETFCATGSRPCRSCRLTLASVCVGLRRCRRFLVSR